MDWDTAKRLVQDVEEAFGSADLTRVEQEMRGRDAIMGFLRAPASPAPRVTACARHCIA